MFEDRNLPELKSRAEMLEILQREEYGYLPPKPDAITWEEKVYVSWDDHAGSVLTS